MEQCSKIDAKSVQYLQDTFGRTRGYTTQFVAAGAKLSEQLCISSIHVRNYI